MSYAEDMGYDAYSLMDVIPLDERWADGHHVTKEGIYIELSEMEASHLINTINYFKDTYDTTPLENELKRRKLTGNKTV